MVVMWWGTFLHLRLLYVQTCLNLASLTTPRLVPACLGNRFSEQRECFFCVLAR